MKKNKIVVCFQGGLGNQMFQYAFYKQLQYEKPMCNILADISDYGFKSSIRRFELEDVFGIKLNKSRNIDVLRLSNRVPGSDKLTYLRRKIDKRISELFHLSMDRIRPNYFYMVESNKIEYHPNKDYYIEGFWNAETDFYDVREEVINSFRSIISKSDFNPNSYIENWYSYETVSVHIRRTDYLVEDGYINLTSQYYNDAIRMINENVSNPLFVFFSDDTDYVEKNYTWLNNKRIITGNRGENSYKDLLLMSECKHNIIANSTFSYWGAYLNVNPQKLVIAPDHYLKNEDRALAVDDWVLIPAR